MNSTSLAIHSSTYGLLVVAPENWRESKTAPPNINIFILLSSLTAPGRPNHAYSINKRHAQCTQVSVSIHTHPQIQYTIPWQKLFVLTRACKRDREKTNTDKDGECRKKCFKRKKSGLQRTNKQRKKSPFLQQHKSAHTHTLTHVKAEHLHVIQAWKKVF